VTKKLRSNKYTTNVTSNCIMRPDPVVPVHTNTSVISDLKLFIGIVIVHIKYLHSCRCKVKIKHVFNFLTWDQPINITFKFICNFKHRWFYANNYLLLCAKIPLRTGINP
jgi:hypothetical protein